MPNQGPLFPSVVSGNTNTVGGGTVAWVNPTNVEAADGIFSTNNLAGQSTTDDLNTQGYGFSIPSTATILGILVEVGVKSDSSSGHEDSQAKLLKSGSAVGSNKAVFTAINAAQVTLSYGGSSDLWGTIWNPSDLNSTSFGFVTAYVKVLGNIVSVDFVRITITYSNSFSDGTTSTVVTSVTESSELGSVASESSNVTLGATESAKLSAVGSIAEGVVLLSSETGIKATTSIAANVITSAIFAAKLDTYGKIIDGYGNTSLNLLAFPEQFDNAAWNKTGGTTINPDTTANPINGDLNADSINFATKLANSNDGISQVSATIIPIGQPYTFSIWLKTALGTQPVDLILQDSAGGSLIQVDQSYTITSAWQRFSVTAQLNVANPLNRTWQVLIFAPFASALSAYSVFAWGAQLELGSLPSPYPPSGTILGVAELGGLVISSTESENIQLAGFVTQQLAHAPLPCKDISDYLSLITSQHNQKPKFMAMVALVAQAFRDMQCLLKSFTTLFDIVHAQGDQLDTLGLWIGVSRNLSIPLQNTVFFSWNTAGLGWSQGKWFGAGDTLTGYVTLSDDQYRTLLMARIASNAWDGTVPGAYAIWNIVLALQNFQLLIQDNQDMSISIIFLSNTVDAITQSLLVNGYLTFRPAGVRIAGYFKATPPVFGWGVQNNIIGGWGVGSWLQTTQIG